METKIILLTVIFYALQVATSQKNYEYEYMNDGDNPPTETDTFSYEDDGNDEDVSKLSNKVKTSEIEALDITIEEFVNELKRRKAAKEHKKQKLLKRPNEEEVVKGVIRAKNSTNKNLRNAQRDRHLILFLPTNPINSAIIILSEDFEPFFMIHHDMQTDR